MHHLAERRDHAALSRFAGVRAVSSRIASLGPAVILTSIINRYYAESIDIVSGLHEVRNGLAEIPGGHSPRRA
jgi:hypothetical protein